MPESREAHDEKPEATRAVITRRAFLKYLLLTVGAALSAPFLPRPVFCAPRTIITRRIPRTDEHLPVIGMGTWQTFHVGSDTRLRDARTDVLRTFLAILILLFALYKASEKRVMRFFRYQPRAWHGLIGGGISGFSSAIANTGASIIGPPATIYLLMQDLQPRVFIATTALFFMILNYIKIPFYAAAGLFNLARIVHVAWLLPLVPVGVWLGRLFVVRVSPKTFELVILVFLVISALLLLLT